MSTQKRPGLIWACAVLTIAAANQLLWNLWHAFDTGMPHPLAVATGAVPVLLALGTSALAARVRCGNVQRTLTYGVMLAAIGISILAQYDLLMHWMGSKAVAVLFPTVGDLATLIALHVLIAEPVPVLVATAVPTSEPVVELNHAAEPVAEPEREPEPLSSPEVICVGRDGLFQVRGLGPVPSAEVQANRLRWEEVPLGGSGGTEVNLEQVRRGSHSQVLGGGEPEPREVRAEPAEVQVPVQVPAQVPVPAQVSVQLPVPVPVPVQVPAQVANQRNRRADQVQAVRNLIEERGYDAVTLAVVQAELKIAKTTAFHRLRDARAQWNAAQARTGTDDA
ncbi:hypothetical protein [Actinomadura litoris]|uniref:hypothetical protein n=1 Tax=Actinomadura litoris TaxID=2678616 RepID=UPI001FA77620|nr:hypothetical protein [Actinomadura litoris]